MRESIDCDAPSSRCMTTSILDDPVLAETTLLQLLRADTDKLINYGQAAAPLVNYARHWLKLVGAEIRDEMMEGLLKRPRGMECTVTVLGPVKDSEVAHWLTIKTKEVSDDDDDTPDPPTMHLMVLSLEHDVVFYISGYQPDRRGDKFRAIALDAEALRQARVAPPRELPRAKAKCVELASASTALQRVHALCNINKLDPTVAAAMTGDEKLAAGIELANPWRPLDAADAFQQGQLGRLNPGQRAALCGLDGAVSVVQVAELLPISPHISPYLPISPHISP